MNYPRIAVIISEGTEEYFILCEQKVLCKVESLKVAIFITLAAYFCFNLEYPRDSKNVILFLQDYVLELPDDMKRTASYLSISTDINNNIP